MVQVASTAGTQLTTESSWSKQTRMKQVII